MPKRARPTAPSTNEEALAWIAKHATMKQMKMVTPPQKSRIKMYEQIQSMDCLRFAQTWFEEHQQRMMQSSAKLQKGKESRDNYRENWMFLSTFLQRGKRLMITLRPKVFYHWFGNANATSERYNDQKTQRVEVEITSEMPVWNDKLPTSSFWSGRRFRVRLLHPVRVEYALAPSFNNIVIINGKSLLPLTWAYDTLPENHEFCMIFCPRPMDGYDRGVNIDSWKYRGLRFVDFVDYYGVRAMQCIWDAERYFFQEALCCIFPPVLSKMILTFLV